MQGGDVLSSLQEQAMQLCLFLRRHADMKAFFRGGGIAAENIFHLAAGRHIDFVFELAKKL